jgi:hypothetical protein
MYFAHIDRTDSFIGDCEKLRPLSEAEATGLLAALRMLDRQEPNTMTYQIVPSDLYATNVTGDVLASNIPGTALGITYRHVGDRVQVLRCQRQ